MAADEEERFEGRLESTIQLRIGEAKNLPPSHELRHTRDSYVVVALDQEEIFRTAAAEKTLNPFFGEGYSFRVPRDFRYLSFYICDSEVFGRDYRLGKVAFRKQELMEGSIGEEQWYPIFPIHPDSEVQGKVHMAINIVERLVELNTTQFFLSVSVFECCGLSAWGNSGLSDPFCQIVLLGPQGVRSEIKKSQVKKKTVDPKFYETFEYPIDIRGLSDTFIRVSIWHQTLLVEHIFLGEVNISLASLDPSKSHDGWYLLSPRPLPEVGPPRVPIGSMRLWVTYSQDCIYPLKAYEQLKRLLLESLEHKEITDSALYILNEVFKDRATMGRALVKIFLKLNKLKDLLRRLIDHEVNNTIDANTLFRGNSLVSKVIDEFMKLVGKSYLQKTLQYCIDEIFDARKACEIDPMKLSDGDNLEVNMANLLFFVEKILSAITSSARSCPRLMCCVFSMLREAAVRRFPEKRETVQYNAVSGFVFLRFFAPAILNPKLFQLRPEYPSPVVARTLTLISKTIQNLGNIGGMSQQRGSLARKEDFMAPLNMALMDHSHVKAVKDYLLAVSDPGGGDGLLADTVYREGILVKRSQGRKRGPKNFRRRYFCLTDKCLMYAKSKGDSPLCIITVDDLLAVERVDDTAFGMKFMFQLVQPERILYMQAKNSVDLMEWLTALAKACSHSWAMRRKSREADLYHSGAFINGSWTCCNGVDDDIMKGCKPISLAVKMLGSREDIDLERELHSVYRMFLEGQAKLLTLKDEATSQARDQTNGEDSRSSIPKRVANLCELLVFVKNLELACNIHIASTACRLGSKDAPYSCPSGEALVVR